MNCQVENIMLTYLTANGSSFLSYSWVLIDFVGSSLFVGEVYHHHSLAIMRTM